MKTQYFIKKTLNGCVLGIFLVYAMIKAIFEKNKKQRLFAQCIKATVF
jgi:hypothetical protein